MEVQGLYTFVQFSGANNHGCEAKKRCGKELDVKTQPGVLCQEGLCLHFIHIVYSLAAHYLYVGCPIPNGSKVNTKHLGYSQHV